MAAVLKRAACFPASPEVKVASLNHRPFIDPRKNPFCCTVRQVFPFFSFRFSYVAAFGNLLKDKNSAIEY